MSLNLALSSGLSSIKVNSEIMALISANISNAGTAGYSKQIAEVFAQVVGGNVVGIDVGDITRSVSEQLLAQINVQNGNVGKSEALSDYMNTIQTLYGTPGGGNDINTKLNKFFEGLSGLASSPDVINQSLAVKAGTNFASFISTTANKLINNQFAADLEIDETVSTINTLLGQIRDTNITITTVASNGQNINALLDQRDQLVNQLAELINITTELDSSGRIRIFTNTGSSQFTLLNPEGTTLRLAYDPTTSTLPFTTGGTLAAINVEFTNADGDTILTQELTPGGTIGEIEPSSIGGRLGGLLEIRDVIIPELLDQLDVFATTLIEQVNAAHNNGVSFPPSSLLTGVHEVDGDTDLTFTGQAMFAVLNSDGTPAVSPYSHLTENDDGDPLFPPLVIDFDALGNDVTPERIAKEFNEYYNEIENWVQLGPLANLNIVGNTPTGSGPITNATFNLEGMNIGDGDATVVVNNITVSGGVGASVSALPAGLTGGYTIEAGERSFPSSTFTVNFVGAGVHTISVDVTVTDADGVVTTSVITYSFDPSQAASNVEGERYPPVTANQDGTIINPNPLNSLATMSFVDEDGNPVSAGASGFMKITANKADTGIGISELTSEEDSTERGFSHFFALNNFFVETEPSSANLTPNQALEITVSQRIIDDPSLIARAALALSPQPSSSTSFPLYTYEISAGGVTTAQAMVEAFLSSHTFGAAGRLPEFATTLSEYGSNITEIVALITSDSLASEEREGLIKTGMDEQRDAQSGVNIDEELTKMIEFQNLFSASARVIKSVDELFDDLLAIV